MATLVDAISGLRDRRLADLDALQEDHALNTAIWGALVADVQRRGDAFSVLLNPTTGKAMSGDELADHAALALLRLNERSLRDVVSVFELALAEIFRAWLAANPALLGGKGVALATLFQSESLQEVRDAAVGRAAEERVLTLMHGPPARWFAFLRQLTGRDAVGGDQAAAFAEAKAGRDVLEHNGGMANRLYLDKSGPAARYADGERMTVDEDYHAATLGLIRRLIEGVCDAAEAAAKLGPAAAGG